MLLLDEGKPAMAQQRLEELSELDLGGVADRIIIGSGYQPSFLAA
jgi:hypothetical protein